MSVQHEGREGEGRASVMEEHVCENGTVSQLTLLTRRAGDKKEKQRSEQDQSALGVRVEMPRGGATHTLVSERNLPRCES
jgi:hypothetical protein